MYYPMDHTQCSTSSNIEADSHQSIEGYSDFTANVRTVGRQPPLTSTFDQGQLGTLLDSQHVDSTFFHTVTSEQHVETLYQTFTINNSNDQAAISGDFSDMQSDMSEYHSFALPSRIADRPHDLTEPDCRLDPPPTEVTEQIYEEPFDVIVDDGVTYFYTKIEEGSNKSKLLIIEDYEGEQHRLVKKMAS